MSEEHEPSLVDAARRADQDAWELLYRRVYPRLRAYLARRVGYAYVEDAVNETMARAVAGIDGLTLGPAGFDGWVFGIARHVAADHHRRTGRSQRHVAATFVAGGAVGVEAEPGEDVLAEEDRARVRRAFDRLSPAERELLELRVVAGLSAEQAAAVLGKRPGAVRTAQSRALQRLRALMEHDDG